MATMYIDTGRFYLRSSWQTKEGDGQSLKYSKPSTASEIRVFSASSIPAGSTIQSAILTVDASEGYTGGVFKINDSQALVQDMTSLFQAGQDGAYADFGVTFTFKANGGAGAIGSHLSVTVVKAATIEVTYTAGEGAAFDPNAYRNAALAPSRKIKPRGLIRYADGATQPIDQNNIIQFEINEGYDGGVLFGTATSAMIEMRLANADGEWLLGGAMRGNRTLYGAEVTLEIGMLVADKWVYTPAGTYVIDELKGREGEPSISVSGYDQMSNALQKKFEDSLSYPATLSQILAHIIQKSGMGINGVLMANRVVQIAKKPDWGEECTLREALAFVCAAGASYAYITRDNVIGIADAWKTAPVLTLSVDHYMELMHDERTLTFNRLVVTPRNAKKESDNIHAVVHSSIEELPQNSLYIDDNPLFEKGRAHTSILANGVKEALTDASWRALDVRWRGDPSVTIGTRVTVTDTRGQSTETTIMAQTLTWDEGFDATAICDIDINETMKAGAVTGGGMINTKKVALESIAGQMLSNGSVTADKIEANAVTAEKIDAGSVTAEKLAAQAVEAKNIKAGTITANEIAAGAITGDKIYGETITGDKIAGNTIAGTNIRGETITGDKIYGETITGDKIAGNTIAGTNIKGGTITGDKIAGQTITGAHIESGTIEACHIKAGTITAESGVLGEASIGSAQIANGAVTNEKVLNLSADKITAGTLDASKVTVNNLTADNITTGTLNGQVIPVLGSDKIADGAVTGDKLADKTVTFGKLSGEVGAVSLSPSRPDAPESGALWLNRTAEPPVIEQYTVETDAGSGESTAAWEVIGGIEGVQNAIESLNEQYAQVIASVGGINALITTTEGKIETLTGQQAAISNGLLAANEDIIRMATKEELAKEEAARAAAIAGATARVATVESNLTSLEARAGNVELTLQRTQETVSEHGSKLDVYNQHFVFDAQGGFTIRSDGDLAEFNATNAQMSVKNGMFESAVFGRNKAREWILQASQSGLGIKHA